jgi:ketosteroid isomerase-like protein
MNQRNELISLAQVVYSAFAARDFERLDHIAALDCAWEAPGVVEYMPWVGRHVGGEGMREFMAGLDERLVFKYFVPDAFHADTVSGAVFSRGLAVCTVRATGRTYQNNFAHFLQFDGNLLTHFREYPDTVWQFIASYPQAIGDLPEKQAERIAEAKRSRA